MSPTDSDAYFSTPELFMPEYDEVHISVTFTWDIEKGYWLKKQWEHIAPVGIGGVAIDGESKERFIPGMYLKNGVSITSRGCPNRCGWCIIKSNIIEFEEIPEGRIIQDNNLLACSRSHLDKVFQMLSYQKNIEFLGGLESSLVDNKLIEQLRGLRIGQVFLAYDHPSSFHYLKKATSLLSKYFVRNKIRCYVLIGYKNDTIEKARERLIEAWEVGTLPFAMLYKNKKGKISDPLQRQEWRRLQKIWARPASIKALAKNGFEDIKTLGFPL